MIYARITHVEQTRRFNTFPTMGGGIVHQDFDMLEIELRVSLVGDARISDNALHLIEAAIEQALNEPLPPKQKAVPMALSPGPRKITL